MRLDAKVRYRTEVAVATVAAALFVLNLVWRDWIEEIFGWDPDKHNGAVEWLIVFVLLVVALMIGQRAWVHRRRLGAAAERE